MCPLERSSKPSVQPAPARRAAGVCDSVVVLAGSGVLISARVTKEGSASGLSFIVIEGGVIHASSH